MKRLILLGFCILIFIAAYGCATENRTNDPSAVSAESSAIAEQNSDASVAVESGEDSQKSETESLTDASSQASESESIENTSSKPSDDESEESIEVSHNEGSEGVSEEVSSESSQEVSQEISTEISEEVSQEISEESSEYIPEESSEYIPEDDTSSEPPPDESEDNNEMQGIGDAEFLPTGYILYNGAAYHSTQYNADIAQAYADTYARYAELFPNTRINVITPPQSAININNPEVYAMINDQGVILDQMESHIYGGVNFVNLRSIIEAHRGEYMYFKSDYHWTQLGAYYAYCAFAESVGLTPTPLSSFEKTVVTDNFVGRTYDYAQDERVLSFVDTIYAYMPTKAHTMTVYNSDLTVNRVYKNCIYLSKDSYSCFIAGDQPYTVINVPENDQEKTVLVIKESSGNAFVPFLTEHYGNIIVIDPRSINIDIRNLVTELGVDDIIFHATASTCSRTGYNTYYRALIGE